MGGTHSHDSDHAAVKVPGHAELAGPFASECGRVSSEGSAKESMVFERTEFLSNHSVRAEKAELHG